MPRWRGLALVVAAMAMVFAIACGGDDDESDGDSNGDGGSGAWTGALEAGTEIELTLWVDPASEPELEEFEAFRQAANAPAGFYAKAVATNDGDQPDAARFATLTDDAGEPLSGSAIEVNFLCAAIPDWITGVSNPPADVTAQYTELFNNTCQGNTLSGPAIPAGESVTYYLFLEGSEEPSFERVFMGIENELKQ